MAPSGWKESGTAMFQWSAKRGWLRAGCIYACAALAGAAVLSAQQQAPQQQAQPQPPLIRVEVKLVHVAATVKNQAGDPVGTLSKEDFELYDNGAKQEIAFLQHTTDLPLSIALLIDTSGSTSKELKYELDCASRFLHALLLDGNPEDTVGLYDFAYDINTEPYTHSFARLDRYLKDLDRLTRGPHPELGTSLWDALFFASRDLELRGGRKVIIVVTDGGDTTSQRDVHQAL